MTGRPPLQIGSVVTTEGLTGKVIADITHGLYSPNYTEADWSYLHEGFLWICETRMGLVHWDDVTNIDPVG